MLIVSGSIIYTATKVSNKLKAKYPTVDCKMFEDIYEGEIDDWQIEAANEFTANDKLFRDGKDTHFAGIMQCFCDREKKENGQKATEEKIFNIVQTVNGTEQETEVQVCKQLYEDKAKSAKVGGSISLIIIVINLILKEIIIRLITWIGEDTISEQLSSITNGVFYAQFFNTGILLLLVNGNMTEHSPKSLTKFMDG